MEEYKQRFELRVAACHDTCRLRRRVRIRVLRETGHHWPRARVLAELRARHRAGRSVAWSRLPVGLQLSIRRRFGSWDRAMERIGLDPPAHRLTRRWDPDSIVAAVREVAGQGTPCSAKRAQEEHNALYRAVVRWVGRWSEALRRAGLDPADHHEPSRWSLEVARRWIRTAHRAGRSVRTTRAPGGLVGHVRRETGAPWSAFVESLGVPYPGGRKRMNWSDDAVLEAILDRQRRNLAMNAGAVKGDHQALHHQARNRFGSWDHAVRAAGLEPICRREPRTKAGISAEIRRRRRARRPLDRAGALADARRFVRAAERLFGSWGRALEAAGIPRGTARRVPGRPRRQR